MTRGGGNGSVKEVRSGQRNPGQVSHEGEFVGGIITPPGGRKGGLRSVIRVYGF